MGSGNLLFEATSLHSACGGGGGGGSGCKKRWWLIHCGLNYSTFPNRVVWYLSMPSFSLLLFTARERFFPNKKYLLPPLLKDSGNSKPSYLTH